MKRITRILLKKSKYIKHDVHLNEEEMLHEVVRFLLKESGHHQMNEVDSARKRHHLENDTIN